MKGAKSAYILPYPYEKGHFCLYYESSVREYAFMRDETFAMAADEWNMLPFGGAKRGDDEDERIHTYARLLLPADSFVRLSFARDEKLLLRIVMDAHLPGMRTAALELLSALYPRLLCEGGSLAALRAAALKLAHILL